MRMSMVCTVKLVVFLAFFLFAECAAGSCLSYGHSCWGAHGKRSGSPHVDSNRLLLARLIQPNLNENDKDSESVANMVLNEDAVESNPLRGMNDYDSAADILFDDTLPSYDDIPRRFKSMNGRRIPSRLLKKRST